MKNWNIWIYFNKFSRSTNDKLISIFECKSRNNFIEILIHFDYHHQICSGIPEIENAKMSILYLEYHITYPISDAFSFSGELLQDFLSIYFLLYFLVLSLYFWKLSWMPKHIRSVNWKGFRLIQAKDKPRSEQTIRLPYMVDILAFGKIKKKTKLKQLIGNILQGNF